MKNKLFSLMGILVMVLVFGMTVIGCNNGTTDNDVDIALNGTWFLVFCDCEKSLDMGVEYACDEIWYMEYFRFNNGSFEIYMVSRSNNDPPEASLLARGSYTTSNGIITMNITHIRGESFGFEAGWFTRGALRTALIADSNFNMSESEIDEMLNYTFSPMSVDYSIHGNTLTLSMLGQITTLKRMN
ncbi:MAG: hypothetical protein FWC97_01805 [Treponema sp.]|nr:hypothetical protein [Treponema sp.]